MHVVNKRTTPFTLDIGRGTIFGNPFTHLPLHTTLASVKVGSREEAVQAFEDWLRGTRWQEESLKKHRLVLLEAIPQIPENAILGCYCKPLLCHGDIIIKIWIEMRKAA
jgi:hypothetical protein